MSELLYCVAYLKHGGKYLPVFIYVNVNSCARNCIQQGFSFLVICSNLQEMNTFMVSRLCCLQFASLDRIAYSKIQC
jgi:hypothetical protein